MKKLNLIISGLLGLALYACGENDAFCTRDLQLFHNNRDLGKWVEAHFCIITV